MMAVESRMNPVFVHDPRKGQRLDERFSLEGNPDPDKTWTTTTLEYLDDAGQLQLMEMPFTPASFALTEGRFKKHFSALPAEAKALPVEEYIELSLAEREGYTPFVYSSNAKKQLIRLAVSPTLISLVEDRRRYWQILQYLDGQHLAAMDAEHKASMDALMTQYQDSLTSKENAMDSFARAMSELAASSQAPVGGFSFGSAPAPSAPAAISAAPVASSTSLIHMTEQDLCNNCKTCYQDIPELFEKTRKIIHGESHEVAQIIPGAMEKVTVTPELENRIQRVIANCDAEILE
jgi:pyruvate-ferredoxin/flavodoxin oxidoreductase